MSRRKKGSSLFEVFGGGMNAPQWLDKGGKSPQPSRPAATPLRRPPEIDRPIPSQTEQVAAGGQGGRLTISLGYPSCAAVLLGLLVLLAGAYKLGRMAGPDASPPAATQSANPLAGNQDRGGYDYESAQATAKAALPDDQVLVVQEGIANMEDAKAIQRYLWSAGLTTLVNNEPGLISVIDTAKISGMDADQLRRYRQDLANLGKDAAWKLRTKYDFSASRVFDLR